MALHDEEITEAIIGAAIVSEVAIGLEYKGLLVPASYRIDCSSPTGSS